MTDLRFSIITVCKNSQATIAKTCQSVDSQNHDSCEHIFVDGLSIDSTLDCINATKKKSYKIISEADDGIYDAMNKGFFHCGGDVVCFLNSDDSFCDPNVLRDVAAAFDNPDVDFVYGDLALIDQLGNVIGTWVVGGECEYQLNGAQIPHPTFFVRRSAINKLDYPFDVRYRISADLKQQLVIINLNKAKGFYINRPLVYMLHGGESTNSLKSYFLGWQESMCIYNELFHSGGFMFTLRKIARKLTCYNPLKIVQNYL